jgi:hypothetical protein
MIRSPRPILWSTPLATMMIAALTLWGCGGSSGGGGEAGNGGTHAGGAGGKAGSAGLGGKAGGSAGASGGAAGTGVAGTTGGAAGEGGSAAGAGGGTAGAAGGAAGTGTAGAGGSTAGAGAGGSAAGAGGSAAGAGGASAGTGGGAGGAGGTPFTCTDGAACALPNSVRGICASNACVACSANAACAAAYPTDQVCVSGNCVACGAATDCSTGQICDSATCASCTTDGQCVAGYGANHLCQSGTCVAGMCRAVGGCAATGLICNTTALTCGQCTTDTQCTTEYGADHICSGGVCISGSCHDSTVCTGGQICDPTSHECGACASDAACQNDPNVGPGHLCQGNVCIVGTCRTAPDCKNTAQICSSTFACGNCSANADCTAAYGANHVCASGACVSGTCTTSAQCGGDQLCNTATHLCQACTTDGQCTADTTYGPMHICLSGQCLAGNCHDVSSDCTTAGQICGATTAHTCGSCGSDGACVTAYGTGNICLASGLCVMGNCHGTSAECTGPNAGFLCVSNNCTACTSDGQCTADSQYGSGNICSAGTGTCGQGNCHATSTECTGANAGLICGASKANTCGTCSSDSQCNNDPSYKGDICVTTAGTGKGTCTSATCTTADAACSANTSDFCCPGTSGNSCTAGNCCVDNDCAAAGVACVGHTCSTCNPVSGNKFYVDPVNGNDLTATGSNMAGSATAPGCAFKTITQAIHQMPTTPFPNSQIILVGTAGTTTGLSAGDVLPITLPTNTTLSTTGGPITIALLTAGGANANAGFRLLNNASGIAGDPSAPLTLDGGTNNNAGIAISVAPVAANAAFTSSISNVTIQNTLGDGIRVTNGVLTIGAGVVVTGSSADGLDVRGGSATINNPSGTQTLFTHNAIGILAQLTGSVNVIGTPGTPVPSNSGTVVTSFNTTGLEIAQTVPVATTATNSINGLVSWGSGTRDALFDAGSRIQVRDSVFGAGPEGIRIATGAGGTAAQNNDISTIDLGTTSSFGGNYIQAPNALNGHHANVGICVALAANQATQTLLAAGNFLTTGANPGVEINCATTAGTVGKAANCNANPATTVSIGNTTAATTTVNETLSMCN